MSWTATSIRELIAKSIEHDILAGIYETGQQLKQDAICKQFNVSAAPVREALRQLESDGLVLYRPNRGMFVADVGSEELLGVLLPVRLTLEKFAIRHTMSHMTRERWETLEAMVAAMQRGARDNDWGTINEADVRFHELTVLWSEQPHTVQLWKAVQSRTRAQIYRLAPRHKHGNEVVGEHSHLVECFRSGDARLIFKALKDHILVSAAELLAADDEASAVSETPALQ